MVKVSPVKLWPGIGLGFSLPWQEELVKWDFNNENTKSAPLSIPPQGKGLTSRGEVL
jgi:hypothetical protein